MPELSRRGLLLGSSTLGAVSAFGVIAPAPAWTWSPTASVIGTGTGIDPRQVWDDEADSLVAALFARGEVDLVNELLAGWTHNDQALPPGLPVDVHAFLERARQLPAWTDQAKLTRAFSFYERRGLYLGVLYGLGSGMMSCVIPREAKAVYYSAGGAEMKDRIDKTAKLGYDIGVRDAFGPGGQMVVTCLKTRLTHAAVRHLLPQSSHWRAAAQEAKPISQADIMVTWHSLATFSFNKLTAWRVPMPAADSAAFLHLWQVTAHLLGVADEYIPATWAESNAQARQVLDPILAPTPEGVKLATILLNLAAEYDAGLTKPMLHAFTRYCLGDQIAGWLEVPREPVTDPLVKSGWPLFIAFRESTMWLPLAPQGYWLFDEFLRVGVRYFLGEGRVTNITMPTGNNPNHS
ncbi:MULTISPECIES: oxygenase MpaB family protein [unclassified Nocardioides]|uniref:oxygenase MpaB family protein n=1 Tax=unclassified Nocardioides TaxID=2615069 RepID=UPI0006F2CE51|nr:MULTISPECIES: oxygenase MpaB family protein [unclassified Nocardioides]KRA38205.1 Latex clearing protein [Nocardioides sp. Root614]KRA92165.1 Latex clearing protein [Nocardioides sp. Root682]